ncbi:negative regulator of mitosis [Corynespora cassiicola Philippines]|uniref:Negative regulator of mitosis n=1 Tax=Corynespora cassiicola Philippines TaxID=1448308 RepID=A0A2T2NAQ2_CORCC|nr:negative regulator of mitosis [Corynespora cassiicola Philippines]
MASLRSVGVHKPAALQYLIAESILSEDSTEQDCTWETSTDGSPDAPVDEIVTTEYHVVWSRSGVVRKVFNFEIEQEKVIQALLTWFPVEEPSVFASQTSDVPGGSTEFGRGDQSGTYLTQGTQPAADPTTPADTLHSAFERKSRALVVFLKSQAHVFFLSGATHVINLPFEVDRAFAAARGVVVQRKLAPPNPTPLSPQIPSAPPNSFLANQQSFLSQTFSSFYQHQPRHGSTLGPTRSSRLSKPISTNGLFLEELVRSSAPPSTEGLPRVFSFTDPLSELGLVVHSVKGSDRNGFLTTSSSGHRRLEPVDKAEEIIYVSPQNEIYFDRSGNDKPLLIVVTANYQTNIFTVWSAAYLDPKLISASRKSRLAEPLKKARRRSSYGTTAPGTGATTPAIRSDRLRESFGGTARNKTKQPSFNVPSQTKEKLSDQAVDDALLSQLNPEFDMTRHPKESRRVSSLLSRAELSTSFDKTAFQDLATQRNSLGPNLNASFGASQRSRHSLGNDRTSFGGFSQSRNRASTPGSVTSRMSLGAVSIDDTFDDIMDDTLDTLEDYDELDDLFGPHDSSADRELRKELVMSAVQEIPAQKYMRNGLFALNDPTSEDQPASKVFTFAAPINSATLHERKLYLYIIHPSLENPLEVDFSVTRKRLSASASATQSRANSTSPLYACVPKFNDIRQLKGISDAIKLVDQGVERLISLGSAGSRESHISLGAGWGIHLPTKFNIGPLKLFNPHAVFGDEQMRVTAGLKRTINPVQPLQHILAPGPGGMIELIDGEWRRHRIQIHISPTNPFVARLFSILSAVLANHIGDFILEIWWDIRKSLSTEKHADADWIAFIATLFTLATPFIDDRTKKSSNRTRPSHRRTTSRSAAHVTTEEHLGNGNSAWRLMCSRRASRPQAKSWKSTPWQWAQQSQPSSVALSPPSKRSSNTAMPSIAQQILGKQDYLILCAELARQFIHSPIGKAANDHWRRLSPSEKQDLRISTLSEVVVILHLFREECKLNTLSSNLPVSENGDLAPVLAQLGHWLQWESWSWKRGGFYDLEGGSTEEWNYEDSRFTSHVRLHGQPWDAPPSILEWISIVVGSRTYYPFPTLASLIRQSKASPHSSVNVDEVITGVTPRTKALQKFFRDIDWSSQPRKTVELIERCGITVQMLATLPETAKAPLMEAITRCQANPPTTWTSSLLKLVQREDLDLSLSPSNEVVHDIRQNQSNTMISLQSNLYSGTTRDVHTICQGVDKSEQLQPIAEWERHYITRLIFNEDRRFMEAHALLEPLKQTTAEYRPENGADEAAILEGQKVMMQWVMIRTFSLPAGSSMAKFNSKKPLLTEKYPLYGFSTSCLMKPMGNVMTAERALYSEEKFFWAFFNAGVAAGLSISRDAQGIDTSWIMYNKPNELTNKHAGLLLGLGLNGHLKTIAKWLSFKYLTPKHTMTSVGLLLGLSASYMGTMDTLVTRLLSVHVTRMLPPGAAELNLSPYTQTTGLMGIGLLYYNTQHRRMSEVMLSEIEHVDEPDPSEPPDSLRDEAYRLAAGFALGFINLGKGSDLQGLHDMRIVERLLSVAVAPKPVNIVHILDQATAGAVIAIALVFMKTHDEAVARKIEIPDTLPQFDYVRPDIFLLRTLAKHLIMWDHIEATDDWVIKNLPREYRDNFSLKSIIKLRSSQMPFFNILAGLLWSVSLKYAGTGDTQVRDFLIKYLDQFMRVCKLPALRYDSKLARNTVRNCQDLLALSVATVMAGTGDLDVFRRLRALHGRVGPEVPYGSHLAAHMAFGALFVAGGTHTFSTSNKAIASLICAFYPIYPTDVQDSKAHLQAFRHFWVLATEPRCLIVRDVDTGRAISMDVTVQLRDGFEKRMFAPCLIPEIDTIANIRSNDVAYWPTTLDFVNNPRHLETFRVNQTLHVRRRSARDMYTSTFSATLVALNDAQSSRTSRVMWDWLFTLPALAEFEVADIGLILPADPQASTFLSPGATVVDHRLALRLLTKTWSARDLWELRGVFEWAEGASKGDGRLKWLGREVVERLKAVVLERGRLLEGA